MNCAADSLIVREDAEVAEQERPIVLAPADERQLLGPRIAYVYGNIPAVLRDPPQGNRRRMAIHSPREIPDEGRRHDELKERPAREADHETERIEDEMPRLVNGEIDGIEETPRVGVPHERDGVQRERDRERESAVRWRRRLRLGGGGDGC